MKYKWFTAAFLSLCLIPAAGMLVLPEQQAAGNEHLTPKPSLWNAQTGWNADFLGGLTDYVADHFGFRQELVTANAALQTRLLCTSPAEDVIYGTDGWLYYAKTLDDYQNHATLTESEAQQLAQTVKSMQDYCESRGARFLFTIAPNKSSLYPEHMPARYLTEDADGSYERVLPYLEQEGVNYADLFSVFRAHANVLYYKTDSHWTNRGAALAHDYLMNTLGLPHTSFTDEEYTTEREPQRRSLPNAVPERHAKGGNAGVSDLVFVCEPAALGRGYPHADHAGECAERPSAAVPRFVRQCTASVSCGGFP